MTRSDSKEASTRRETIMSAWKAFADGRPLPDGVPDPVILDSWERSRASGVDAVGLPRFRRVPDRDLQSRLLRSRTFVDVAAPHLRWLSAAMGPERHVVYVADEDGVVLLSETNVPGSLETFGLEPGYDWSEKTMGTNGAGTAIAVGGPVAVVGCEHYSEAWHDMTCVAAPVRSPDGSVGGALDLSLESPEPRPDLLVRIAYTAYVMEREWQSRTAPAAAKGSLVKCRECGNSWILQVTPPLCLRCGSLQVHPLDASGPSSKGRLQF